MMKANLALRVSQARRTLFRRDLAWSQGTGIAAELVPTACLQRRFAGVYSGLLPVDPLDGVARIRKPRRKLPEETKPIRGQLNQQEYDEKYGRWWSEKKGVMRPNLYTSIGKHARSPQLSKMMLRWVYRTPVVTKYLRDPYRKRFPKANSLKVEHFAEFCQKEFTKRTLLETACTLPLDGVGCKFWRGGTPDAEDSMGKYFMATSTTVKTRPIKGLVRGDQYINGKLVRRDIAPVAKTLGWWCYSFPEDGHRYVYRPPFPKALSAESPESASTEEA
mmetsp:Transcript_6137/g.10635  ORF Transcript_6137/g.10635 Transcript_6137/m.10635 type:complete len:276 (+) Transcript_6137:34-861(+)